VEVKREDLTHAFRNQADKEYNLKITGWESFRKKTEYAGFFSAEFSDLYLGFRLLLLWFLLLFYCP